MDFKPYNISFQIYARSEEEAERGRKAIIKFIEAMKNHKASVCGDKLVQAVAKLNSSPFIASQIINFFKY